MSQPNQREGEAPARVVELLQLLLLAGEQIPLNCSLCPENIANIQRAATPQGDFDPLHPDNTQQHQ